MNRHIRNPGWLPSRRHAIWAMVASLAMTSRSIAETSSGEDPVAPQFQSPKTTRWRIGLKVDTPVTFTNGLATFPVPMNWPEQSVRVMQQSADPLVSSIQVRELAAGAKQIVLVMPRVLSGSEVEVVFEVEIQKSDTVAPSSTDALVVPSKIDRELKLYMGSSPNIDTTHARIRRLSQELDEKQPAGAWEKVRQIYDAVREKVQYTEGPIRNASDALADGKGDCEDMTSLFVALCRNARIPARMVWIPGHCYPEFYLERAPEKLGDDPVGYWYPCQAAGSEQFGEMQEDRPILQKGDRFKVPEVRAPIRYVSEFFRCDPVGNKSPRIETIREMLTS